MTVTLGRRSFLQLATAATVPWVARRASAGNANGKVSLACIGVGNHGLGWNLDAFLKIPDARVRAVCDVFADRREHARQVVNTAYGDTDCVAYADFREVLARPDIDAVVISTPDHWHVLMSLMAARAGKHVFCEKPTYNIAEGRLLVAELARTGVVYQGGIEDRSVAQYHRLAELVRNGVIGTLRGIHVTLPPGVVFPKEEPAPVPEGLDYELWLGPAPFTPYTPSKTGAQEWRNHWDYSGGKFTDWGAHLIDTAQIAMFEEHGGPVEIDGKGSFPEDALSTTATAYAIRYRYANDVEMVVKSGGTAIRFDGDDGWVGCPAWRDELKASNHDFLKAEIAPSENRMWPRPLSEHEQFIAAIQGGPTPTYTPEDIHRLSTTMHLGNISMRLGRKLRWDPVKGAFPEGDAEAESFFHREPRAPWRYEA